jgi:hypothetical protein
LGTIGAGKIKKNPNRKAPSTKIQAPRKHQYPILIRELRELTRILTGGNRENGEEIEISDLRFQRGKQ